MYSIKVTADFSSAHNLRGYKGKCENLHGHNWKVEVAAARRTLDKIGMVADFREVKLELNKILDKLDHKYLNEITYFQKACPTRKKGSEKMKLSNGVNPTSENIAKYIYDCLKNRIAGLKSVTVWESDNCSAAYNE